MYNDRLTELLSRKLSGEATPAELQELQFLLQSKPGDQYFSEILLTYWHNRNDHSEDQDQQADQHFAHILEMATQDPETPVEMYPVSRRSRLIKKLAIAAAIAVIFSIGLWMTLRPAAQNNIAATHQKKSEVVAGKGIRSKLVLPDGTQVWLNSDSRLSYDEAFDGKQREVTIQGEAYFDVTKNPDRPFIVHTSAIDIRVLGTAFNVKSYPSEKTIETTLIHGLVEVINKNRPDASKIILRPKEKLVFNKMNETMIQNASGGNIIPAGGNNTRGNIEAISITALPRDRADTSLVETSWVYNRLVFEGDDFADLAVKMERWFNVKIKITSEKIANYRLSGSFEDENIHQALQALQYIARFKYKIVNNEVEITE